MLMRQSTIIDILRLDRCFVIHARVCHRRKLYISFVLAGLRFAPTHASAAGEADSDPPSSPPDAMPRPEVSECRPEIREAIERAAFALAVKLPADSAAAGSGPCYAKA
jgi:hypothetical protein